MYILHISVYLNIIPKAQIIIKKIFEIIEGDCYTFNENHSFSENYWLHSSNLKEDGH